jgi:hypothetical protein
MCAKRCRLSSLTSPNPLQCAFIWCATKFSLRHETAARPGGAELVRHLCMHHAYQQVNQEGSHIILETNSPRPHRLSVPNHLALRVGTLNAILRAVAAVKGVEKEEILRGL